MSVLAFRWTGKPSSAGLTRRSRPRQLPLFYSIRMYWSSLGSLNGPRIARGTWNPLSSTICRPFLLELGSGFCFEARQKRITLGNEHDYIDLVFYHRILRCHVLLDLKIRPFSHGDAGQMNFFLNYFKRQVMAVDDNPPVGIILCSDRDQTKVEFATAGLDNQLFVSRYLVALPSAEELREFIQRDREAIENTMRGAHG